MICNLNESSEGSYMESIMKIQDAELVNAQQFKYFDV